MLHPYLKERTEPSHQALEQRMVALIHQIKSGNDYAKFLELMYGYYAALEERIAGFIDNKPPLDFKKRRKADRLLNDIREFAVPDTMVLCDALPAVQSYAGALGAMYVLEGSVLGGKIIARMIKAQLQAQPSPGFSFFLGYGEETGAMWQAFKDDLEQPFDEKEKEEVVEAANDTFVRFKQWIDTHAAN
jgi:heme oxygenase (biliverdin-IX-beta and delta-forming)